MISRRQFSCGIGEFLPGLAAPREEEEELFILLSEFVDYHDDFLKKAI
jgi:hypothetical protein